MIQRWNRSHTTSQCIKFHFFPPIFDEYLSNSSKQSINETQSCFIIESPYLFDDESNQFGRTYNRLFFWFTKGLFQRTIQFLKNPIQLSIHCLTFALGVARPKMVTKCYSFGNTLNTTCVEYIFMMKIILSRLKQDELKLFLFQDSESSIMQFRGSTHDFHLGHGLSSLRT